MQRLYSGIIFLKARQCDTGLFLCGKAEVAKQKQQIRGSKVKAAGRDESQAISLQFRMDFTKITPCGHSRKV